jgi:hypothetical protein
MTVILNNCSWAVGVDNELISPIGPLIDTFYIYVMLEPLTDPMKYTVSLLLEYRKKDIYVKDALTFVID